MNARAVLFEAVAAEEAPLRAEGAFDDAFLLPGVLTGMGSLYMRRIKAQCNDEKISNMYNLHCHIYGYRTACLHAVQPAN